MKKLKVMSVIGTRPEIIRLSRVLARLDEDCDHVLVHTGQNYDYELNQIFFEDLEVRKPNYFLRSAEDSQSVANTIGNLIISVDKVLASELPDAMLILGDTNSCLSVIPAKRRKVPIFHMEAGIIRSPLVYGPAVKANFETMMRCLYRGIPLPFASITTNRRSLVGLDNLVDFIVTCLYHPSASNQILLVSDGEDLSTADLLQRMGKALDKPARLFHLSPWLLKLGAALVNKPDTYHRLCSSLQLDISKTQALLGWSPVISVDEGLIRAAEGFRC